MKTKVVHCKKDKYDIYIGRPSKWGNPFEIGKDGDRDEVIKKYEIYLLSNPTLLDDIYELDGKILGCWCSPKACHGEILIQQLYKRKILDSLEDLASEFCCYMRKSGELFDDIDSYDFNELIKNKILTPTQIGSRFAEEIKKKYD